MFYNPVPNVPISRAKVDLLVKLYETSPDDPPVLEVAIPAHATDADAMDKLCKGRQLKLVTPPEQPGVAQEHSPL